MNAHWIHDGLSHYHLYCGNTYAWIDGFHIETRPGFIILHSLVMISAKGRQAMILTTVGILPRGPYKQTSLKLATKYKDISCTKYIYICRMQNCFNLVERQWVNYQIYSFTTQSPHDCIDMNLLFQSIHSLVVPSRDWFHDNYWLSASMEAVATNNSRIKFAWLRRCQPYACSSLEFTWGQCKRAAFSDRRILQVGWQTYWKLIRAPFTGMTLRISKYIH